jgi:peptide chain release factor 1
MNILEKLEAIYQRWVSIGEEITQPDAMSDMKRYIKLNKDYKDLNAVVEAYKEYKNILENIDNTKDIISK